MPDLGQSASVPAVAAQSLPSQAQLSNNQILCAFAHRVLNQERARLLKEAAAQREKHPAQSAITLQRANALKVAMRFFNHLLKAGTAAPESAGKSTASE